jgi:hypothetical protein
LKPCIFYIIMPLLLLLPFVSLGQSHNYWTRSFNEESSLLSGAVVGGGSGPSAIYYNPASISEVKASQFSLNASLFSFDFVNMKNALGNDINLKSSTGNIEPRFISYMIKSKRFKKWSFEIAGLNNEDVRSELIKSVDKQIDILTSIPGDEKYHAIYHYANHFRDDWIGLGGSLKLNDKLFVGAAMFVTIKSLDYTNSLDIEAYSLNDSIFINDVYRPFYSASYQTYQYLRFNDYRLLWNIGFLYYAKSISFGLNITTPSIHVYSDGKRNHRKEKQSNITMPGTGEPVPDYVTVDYKEKKDMKVSYKTPLSISAGCTYKLPGEKRTLYCSMEFCSQIGAYRMVEAEESTISAGSDRAIPPDWLTYSSGAKPIYNVAVGYSTKLVKDLFLMAGLRTDFNYAKNADLGAFSNYKTIQSYNLDLYHLSCGLSWNILGQDIITGLQYTYGSSKNQRQIANLSDPVEYNTVENLPLQGTRNNSMNSLYNSISVYLGASINFGGKEETKPAGN